MLPPPTQNGTPPADSSQSYFVSSPSVSLPKGGGAIKGIGEKFAANPVTGTGSMTVPITTSAGRSGFGPQLSLSYNSGAGNGPFGFGWSLSLPLVTRKAEKSLPCGWDTEKLDVSLCSGDEDSLPFSETEIPKHEVFDRTYLMHQCLSCIEGLLACIRFWPNQGDDLSED